MVTCGPYLHLLANRPGNFRQAPIVAFGAILAPAFANLHGAASCAVMGMAFAVMHPKGRTLICG